MALVDVPAAADARVRAEPRAPVGLYVHVPFCVSLCPYCDFVVYSGADARGPRNRLGGFLVALHAELALRADGLDARFGGPGSPDRPPLDSVYIGGGTPSLLAARELGALLELVDRRFAVAAGAEVTLEANPGPDERGDAARIRGAGVTRMSIGAQSLDPGELRRLGRRHAPSDVEGAVRLARSAGIESISVDLLYDIPGQTVATWQRTLGGVTALGVDHVSAYALTLDDPDAEGITGESDDHLPVRPGARAWRVRARTAQDPDRAAELYAIADDALAAAGLPWYEVSNWARPGQESRHNQTYWHSGAWEAAGPGAHAYDGGAVRRWTAARLDSYVAALVPPDGTPPRLPPGGSETVTAATGVAERAMLALRTRDGVPPWLAVDPGVAEALAWGRAAGLVQLDRPALTRRGRLVGNELFMRLLPDQA